MYVYIYININILLIHWYSLTVVTTKIPHQNNQGQPVNPIGSSSCAASCPSRGSTPISSGKPIGAPPAWKWNKSSLWCRYIYIWASIPRHPPTPTPWLWVCIVAPQYLPPPLWCGGPGTCNAHPYMGVSKNRGGPPKSSILIGCSIINHPFWGGFPPYVWKHPYIAKLKYFSNLDLPEIRGPISLPKRYLLGAQVVWGPYNVTRYISIINHTYVYTPGTCAQVLYFGLSSFNPPKEGHWHSNQRVLSIGIGIYPPWN